MVIFICGLFSTKAMKRLPSTFAQDFRELLIREIVPKMENVACMAARMRSCAARGSPAAVQRAFTTSVSWRCRWCEPPGLRVMSDILPDTDGRRR